MSVEDLNIYLSTHSFLGNDAYATKEDYKQCSSVKAPDAQKYPHLARWHSQVTVLMTKYPNFDSRGFPVPDGNAFGSSAASKKGAEPKAKVDPKPKAENTDSGKGQAKAKAAPKPGNAVDDDAVRAVADEIRIVKEKLAKENITEKQLKDPPEITALEAKTSHCRVTIVGAGPAGLLAAINFLRRSGKVTYSVDLIETGEDFGCLDAAGLEKKRSWMIGLSTHGLTALRHVPGLYEDYVSKVGVAIDATTIYLGQKAIRAGMEDVGESYVVDRNFIVAALSRYLNEHYVGSGRLTLHYHTKVLFVDPDARRIFARNRDGHDKYLPYDLLIGCDGIRSAVRAAFISSHRDFQCSVADIFTRFKSLHIPLPQPLRENEAHVFPQCVPGMNGIGLPETGAKINIAMGYTLNRPCDEELQSKDARVVADYFRAKFKAFSLPANEFAKQWVEQDWSETGQVHANFYHSAKLQALIMGDAAHATSPSIGQGMNTALADAAALDELLDVHGDERLLKDVLPAFSHARVKEGNALTDIAFYAYSMSTAQQLQITLAQFFRATASKYVPSLVAPDPVQLIGKGTKLSVAYDELTRIGRIQAVRRVNDDARRRYFEHASGMVTHRQSSSCFEGCWPFSKSHSSVSKDKSKAVLTSDTPDNSNLDALMGA